MIKVNPDQPRERRKWSTTKKIGLRGIKPSRSHIGEMKNSRLFTDTIISQVQDTRNRTLVLLYFDTITF